MSIAAAQLGAFAAMRTVAGQPVTYTRGSVSHVLAAVYTRPEVIGAGAGDGGIVVSERHEFAFLASDLPLFPPRIADTVTDAAGKLYRVAHDGSSKHWDFQDIGKKIAVVFCVAE